MLTKTGRKGKFTVGEASQNFVIRPRTVFACSVHMNVN